MAKLWERLEHGRVRRFYHGSDEMYAGVRPHPDVPPGTDMIPQLKHIVVLMMENHSFDNYLGLLGRGDGLPLDPATGQPTATNSRVDGTEIASFRPATTTQLHGAPTQSWHATNLQWN
ncbi:MAG: alkaline phosphatase family protein, partial [Acidimicrobiales bacterium]